MSLKTLQFWIPLSVGPNIGGISAWKGSHKNGPIKHKWRTEVEFRADTSKTVQNFAGAAGRRKPFGALVLPEEYYCDCERVDMVGFALGDALILTPYTVHASIPIRGESMRWTFVIKIEEMVDLMHLPQGTSPFPVDEYLPPFTESIASAHEPADAD